MQFLRAAVELANYGFTQLALQFAVRTGNVSVIKLVSDASLRFIDFDTARAGFNELSMLKFEL